MGFNLYNLRNTCPAKFHASEASGSEKDDLYIFLCISMVQTHDTLERIHFGPGPLFEQTRLRTTRQCYIPNFKQLSLEKIFNYILLAKPGPF